MPFVFFLSCDFIFSFLAYLICISLSQQEVKLPPAEFLAFVPDLYNNYHSRSTEDNHKKVVNHQKEIEEITSPDKMFKSNPKFAKFSVQSLKTYWGNGGPEALLCQYILALEAREYQTTRRSWTLLGFKLKGTTLVWHDGLKQKKHESVHRFDRALEWYEGHKACVIHGNGDVLSTVASSAKAAASDAASIVAAGFSDNPSTSSSSETVLSGGTVPGATPGLPATTNVSGNPAANRSALPGSCAFPTPHPVASLSQAKVVGIHLSGKPILRGIVRRHKRKNKKPTKSARHHDLSEEDSTSSSYSEESDASACRCSQKRKQKPKLSKGKRGHLKSKWEKRRAFSQVVHVRLEAINNTKDMSLCIWHRELLDVSSRSVV
ncbi:hypothetical protein BJ742DRAFT_740335 [Cladochytrium replicatum]|nr:hypothetical protein BJ742DRAFT_740335 [Cladochytrium replicatum]